MGEFPEGLTKAEIVEIKRHYSVEARGRRRGSEKLRKLLTTYRFASIAEAFGVKGLEQPQHPVRAAAPDGNHAQF